MLYSIVNVSLRKLEFLRFNISCAPNYVKLAYGTHKAFNPYIDQKEKKN